MIHAVLFDLDGTLLHSAPDLVAALNWLRGRHGLPELPVAEMQAAASRGALGLLEAGMPKALPETLEAWRLEFLSRYQQQSFLESRLYDGVADVLTYLKKEGKPWGIVTNKPEYLTFPILAAAGLSDSVGCVICGDTIEQRKPHPAPVLLACERLNMPTGHVLYVGDDVRDLEAGRAAGVATCAALYGYGSAELLKPENSYLIKGGLAVGSPSELIPLLRGSRASPEASRLDNG